MPITTQGTPKVTPATESTSLLSSLVYHHDLTTAQDDSSNLSSKLATTTTKRELYYIAKNSFPVLITFLFQYFIQIMIPIYYSSQLGEEYLAACSLSITSFYVSGPVVFNGFSTAMDTFCSTAFGAGNFKKVGLYYQRCTVIVLFITIPISVIWLNAGFLLELFTEDANLVKLCSDYLKFMPIAAPAIVIFECSKRFLQSQNKFSVPTRITVFAVPLCLYLNHTLLPSLNFSAPPISFIITYWFMAISLTSYIYFIDGFQCWNHDITLNELFSEWVPFFQIGIPGVLMIMSEAFAFQVLTFLSTKFGQTELAAQSIVSTLASFSFQLPFSVGICCSTRIANIIGAQSPDYKIAVDAMIYIAFSLSVFNFAWMGLFRYQLATLFSDDPVLISRVCKLFLIVGFNQWLDCVNIICAAVLRGQGRQRIGSILSLISYYAIATPFELFFAIYLGLEVLGLWLGVAVGVSALSLAELYLVWTSDWDSIMNSNSSIVA